MDLTARGFDKSSKVRGSIPPRFRVGCSQCEALVINGVPTHEHGCPNATHECKGCNAIVPHRQTYCEDCND
jgi:hypothetical protein